MAFTALPLAFAAFAALAQPNASSFAGTWTMVFRGDTLARLELQTSGTGLSGRISLGAMHMNQQGLVDEVLSPAVNFTPLFDVVVRDGVLSFARKDDDDTDRFELRVMGDTAQLTFVMTDQLRQILKDNDLPAPKPLTMTRTRR